MAKHDMTIIKNANAGGVHEIILHVNRQTVEIRSDKRGVGCKIWRGETLMTDCGADWPEVSGVDESGFARKFNVTLNSDIIRDNEAYHVQTIGHFTVEDNRLFLENHKVTKPVTQHGDIELKEEELKEIFQLLYQKAEAVRDGYSPD